LTAGLVLAGGVLAGCGRNADVVIAAGTTVVDSGLMDGLVATFAQDHPEAELSVVGLATQEALELGAQGEAGVLITHAPRLEAAFLAEHEARATPVFSSFFQLAGPAPQVDVLSGFTAAESLAEIARRGWTFVSRADGSGTHERELALWDAAGVDPSGADWYVETGQGMGISLLVADQREAFILVEAGTLATAETVSLMPVELAGDGSDLVNPYTAIVPAGAPPLAATFVAWLVSPDGRAALAGANAELFGSALFRPSP
jgi:tungstate transport system substrate-binding protein